MAGRCSGREVMDIFDRQRMPTPADACFAEIASPDSHWPEEGAPAAPSICVDLSTLTSPGVAEAPSNRGAVSVQTSKPEHAEGAAWHPSDVRDLRAVWRGLARQRFLSEDRGVMAELAPGMRRDGQRPDCTEGTAG